VFLLSDVAQCPCLYMSIFASIHTLIVVTVPPTAIGGSAHTHRSKNSRRKQGYVEIMYY